LIGVWQMMVLPMLACQTFTGTRRRAAAALVDEAVGDGERADRGAEVAAVAAPVDEGLVDRDLAVEVVDVVARLRALRDDDGLAGARRGAAMPSVCLA